jgi:HAD superfamily hydrolase (TIGR01509 family)
MDVGGTLWPDAWPSRPGDDREQANRLTRAIPTLTEREATALVAALAPLDHPPTERQQTDRLVTEALTAVAPRVPIAVRAVIDAMSLPARGRVQPFPGASELLGGLARRGVRVIVASNVLWRDGRAQHRDFEDLGLSDYVADYVTSLDVGWRKPHPAFFEAALSVARHPPSECAMVGDSEVNDIAPAHARGMLTIRVALGSPPPSTSQAAYVAGSLQEVAGLLEADPSSS